MARSVMSVGLMMLALVGAQARTQAVPEGQASAVYRLASAQVVSSDGRPPVLKLAASGPIAFEVLPADASGVPARPDRIVARLHGVAAGELAVSASLAPFSLAVSGAEGAGDAVVTIGVGGLSASQMLVLRAGARASELEAAIVTVP